MIALNYKKLSEVPSTLKNNLKNFKTNLKMGSSKKFTKKGG